MYNIQKITRVSATDLVYDQIVREIIRGTIAPGARIKDAELASLMQTSRTPVREALLKLAQEKLIAFLPGRGYEASPLHPEDARCLYPLLWTLEALALDFMPEATVAWLGDLRSLNDRLLKTRNDHFESLKTDMAWHHRLVTFAENHYLTSYADTIRLHVWRYEYRFMGNIHRIEQSVTEHADLIELLGAGKRKQAAKVLKEHWRRSLLLALEPDE